MSDTHYSELRFGFRFGAAEVTRLTSDDKKGWVLMEVKTPRDTIRLYVTKTGLIRVLDVDGRRMNTG